MNKPTIYKKSCVIVLLFMLFCPFVQAQITVDEFMGVNTRRQDPINRMQAVGIIREYHDWYLNEGFPMIPNNENGSPGYPNSQYRWNEAYQELTYTRFDDFYQEIQDSNIIICPTTLGNIFQIIDPSIPFNHPNSGQLLEQKPIANLADSLDPASYIAHAEYLYQYAARYGSTPFSPARTAAIIAPKTHPNETVKTGLGYVTYLEDWNEQDKTYYPNFPKTFFMPEEYAAMLSADYDGHDQTLGLIPDPDDLQTMISTVGIKNADPNMKVAMGGLTDADLDYIKDMVAWFRANRSPNANFGQLPFDALNIHIYVGDDPNVLASDFGISPESADVKQILSEFVTYRNDSMPGVELWLSEFGYDTNDNSPISTPVIGNSDNYEVQGQWITRFYLETIAAGFDRAMLFDLRDICTQPACALFQSSGLLESLDSMLRPKNSWYYVYTMKNALKGMEFDADLSACSDTTCTRVYRFTDPQNGNKKVYAVWSPTASDTSYQYQLSLEGATSGTLVEMELPSIYGIPSNLQGGNPTITVSERPVFVIVGDTYFTPSPCIANLTTDNITCSTATINWDNDGGAQQFQLWQQEGLLTKSQFSNRIANIVDDEIDASLGSYTVSDLDLSSDYTFFLIPQGIGISDTDNFCSIQVTTGATTCKISLDTSYIFDAYTNRQSAYDLVDEQDLFDPICQTTTDPITLWGDNFQDPGMERLSLYLDDYYYIDAITIHDAPAIGVLTIQMADSPNGPWTTIKEYQTIELNKWVTFTNIIPPDKPVRFLRFIASDDDRALIGEVFLCGRLANANIDVIPGIVKNVTLENVRCDTLDLQWEHPFDRDISHYIVSYGNDMQQFAYTPAIQNAGLVNLLPDTTYNFSIVTVDSNGQESDPVLFEASTLPDGNCEVGCNLDCPCQICIQPSWISNENPNSTLPVMNLVDEQETAPVCDAGGNPTTAWGWDFGGPNGNPVAILDLQQVFQLDSFYLYDGIGMDIFEVEYKDEQGNWVFLFNYQTTDFNAWKSFDGQNVQTRFLRMSKLNNGAQVNEIAICGFPVCGEPDSTQLSETICEEETYFFNGQNLSEEGIYYDTLAASNGCDSILELNLEKLEEGDACDDGDPNTTNDEIDEDCNCVGEALNPNVCHVTATVSGDTIWVNNMIQPITKLTIYNEQWSQEVFTCGYYNCNVNEFAAGLPIGIYHVKVQSWAAGWSQGVCDVIIDVEIVGDDPEPDTCAVDVVVNGNTIVVNGLVQPITDLKIYNEQWSQVVYSCGVYNCNTSEQTANLPDGIYHVSVKTWTAGWQQRICNTIIDVEIGGAPPAVCDVEIIEGNDFITVNNMDEPNTSLTIYTGDYHTTLYSCTYGACPGTYTLPNLAPGVYAVKVQSYTSSWMEVCNFIQTVMVGYSSCLSDDETYIFGDIPTGFYQAESALGTNGRVKPISSVLLVAGNSITLDTGFHAVAGSAFTAMIEGCGPSSLQEEVVAESRVSPLEVKEVTPKGFLKIAPNPFQNTTTFQYQLEQNVQAVNLSIHDMTGRILQQPIQNVQQDKGMYSIDFVGDRLAPGMYYVVLRADGEVYSKKMVLSN